jgi:DNA-binding transcriptional MerR regulator
MPRRVDALARGSYDGERLTAMIAPGIPDKLYFRIGEVAKLAGVEPYVLRFWETEFPALKPGKSPTGQRLYRRREVELILEVKKLLYDQKFTIAGARKQLKVNGRKSSQHDLGFAQSHRKASVQNIRREIAEIVEVLKGRGRP